MSEAAISLTYGRSGAGSQVEQDNFLFLGDILTLSLMKVVPEGGLQVTDSGASVHCMAGHMALA